MAPVSISASLSCRTQKQLFGSYCCLIHFLVDVIRVGAVQ